MLYPQRMARLAHTNPLFGLGQGLGTAGAPVIEYTWLDYPGTTQQFVTTGGYLVSSAGDNIDNGSSLQYPNGQVLATAIALNDPHSSPVSDGTALFYPNVGSGLATSANLYSSAFQAGVTAGPFSVISGITISNGIVIALTGA
jgi:hypothetical protein